MEVGALLHAGYPPHLYSCSPPPPPPPPPPSSSLTGSRSCADGSLVIFFRYQRGVVAGDATS